MSADAPTPDLVAGDRPRLRLVTFGTQGTWHEVDATLRAWRVPYAAAPGNLATWLGRRGAGPTEERVVVSVWSPGHAPRPGVDIAERIVREVPPEARITNARSEALPVRIHETFHREAPMTILRVFRGRTRPGELEVYLVEARAGSRLDGQRPDGPSTVISATEGDSGFVTASLWPDWRAIEACTGGDIRRPMATRNAARIESGGPTHYELVPLEG
jgi:hypothetical protein